MRPVMRGLISYADLVGNTLTLEDIMRMNDAILVEAENQARIARVQQEDQDKAARK